jgi:hypothetical protein
MTAGPNNLVFIETLGQAMAGSTRFPPVTSTGDVQFAADESVLWHGTAMTRALRQRADGRPLAPVWSLPQEATVWVTDRRLAYVCRKFAEGDWKMAWTDASEVLASTVNSVRSVARRHGRIAVGQLLHQWPVDVVMGRSKPRLGRMTAFAGVTAVDPWDDALVGWCSPARTRPRWRCWDAPSSAPSPPNA